MIKNLIKQLFDLVDKDAHNLLESKYKTLKSQEWEWLESSQFFIDEIKFLNQEIETLIKERDGARESETILQEKLEKMPLKLNDKYRLRPRDFRYTYRPGRNDLLRNTLNKFTEDTIYQAKYIDWLEKERNFYPKRYTDVDNMIYHCSRIILEFVDNRYMSDIQKYGVSEYWLYPQEAFDVYVKKNKVNDCDGLRAFMYGAIISILIYTENEQYIDRLKCVDVWIGHRYGHAVLAWKKISNEKWVKIESTYRPHDLYTDWFNNKEFFNSVYNLIPGRVFDEKGEYSIQLK